MPLYSIQVSNYLDDTSYEVLVLSDEPLTKENTNIEAIAEIDKSFQYISNVHEPTIKINAWDESEIDKFQYLITRIKSGINI